MRLDKFLCDCSIGTRSEVKAYIKKDKVKVNGIIVKNPALQVTNDDEIFLNDELVLYEEFAYYILNKPAGCVTATIDNLCKTVMDYIDEPNKDKLFPVGRLDKDTEGLLLITNDGKLAHELLAPKKHVSKRYFVKLKAELNENDIEQLEMGVDIGDDKITKPAKVEIITPSECFITIVEVRFHQVKRMFMAINNEVVYLKRVSFAKLSLPDDLKLGDYIKINLEDII